MPGFYDKLLQVPLLNLSAGLLDRLARSPLLGASIPRRGACASLPRRRHLAYMSVWAVAFGAMSASGYLGDKHPGQWCRSGRRRARPQRAAPARICTFCRTATARTGPDGRATNSASCWPNTTTIAPGRRWSSSARAGCGFPPAATSTGARHAGTFRRDAPTVPTTGSSCAAARARFRTKPAQLYARACVQGWPGTCGRT